MPSSCWNNSAEWLSSSVIDSRRLQYFLAVYDHGSLGRAAAALDLTQPALSKTIHQLERELNVKLFDRTPKGLVPTVYGDTLSLHARAVDSELRHAAREIALLSGAAKGLVRIGTTPSLAGTVLPIAVRELRRERPGIELAVYEGLAQAHAPALRRGDLDLVVGGWTRGMGADLVSEVLREDVVRIVAHRGHPVADGPADLATLSRLTWVLPPHTEFWLDHLDRTFVSRGLPPPAPAVISNSAAFIVGMILRTDAVSYLPTMLVRRALASGEIVHVEAEDADVQIDISVTVPARRAPSATVSAVIEAVRAACARIEDEAPLTG
jgi:DNA-binding transcriptional LysR family regulator